MWFDKQQDRLSTMASFERGPTISFSLEAVVMLVLPFSSDSITYDDLLQNTTRSNTQARSYRYDQDHPILNVLFMQIYVEICISTG